MIAHYLVLVHKQANKASYAWELRTGNREKQKSSFEFWLKFRHEVAELFEL